MCDLIGMGKKLRRFLDRVGEILRLGHWKDEWSTVQHGGNLAEIIVSSGLIKHLRQFIHCRIQGVVVTIGVQFVQGQRRRVVPGHRIGQCQHRCADCGVTGILRGNRWNNQIVGIVAACQENTDECLVTCGVGGHCGVDQMQITQAIAHRAGTEGDRGGAAEEAPARDIEVRFRLHRSSAISEQRMLRR